MTVFLAQRPGDGVVQLFEFLILIRTTGDVVLNTVLLVCSLSRFAGSTFVFLVFLCWFRDSGGSVCGGSRGIAVDRGNFGCNMAQDGSDSL